VPAFAESLGWAQKSHGLGSLPPAIRCNFGYSISIAPAVSKPDTLRDLFKRASYATPRMTKPIAEHPNIHDLDIGPSVTSYKTLGITPWTI
jgi:hypothetical protein